MTVSAATLRDRARRLDPIRQAVLARLLAERHAQPEATPSDTTTGGSIPRQPRDGRTFPCTPAQQRIWLADQLSPGNLPNVTYGLRLRGPLLPDAIERALAAVVERHESMRTIYLAEAASPGDPYLWPRQRVLNAKDERVTDSALVDLADLTGLPPGHREQWAQEMATAAAAERFNLAHGPLFRVTLFRLAELDHALLVVGHHIAFDEQSMETVIRELASGYSAATGARVEPLPALAVQYADYAAWTADAAQSTAIDERLAYWRERLTPALAELRLPGATDRAARDDGPTLTVRTRLPAGSVTRLRRAGGNPTAFVALLAAFKVLLARCTGGTDITVGTMSSGRGRADLEPVVGCFLNPLVLRTDLDGADTYAEVLRRVRRTVGEAFAREAPFDRVAAEVGASRRSGGHPLFQVAFELRRHCVDHGGWADLAVDVWHHEAPADLLDLTVIATPLPDGGAEVTFRQPAGALEPGAVERLADHFRALVESLGTEGDGPLDAQLDMADDEELAAVLAAVEGLSEDELVALLEELD